MSHFSKEARENVESMLLKEGEELFNTYGLKKVTVDEITEKVNIGKGTFYHFYENKEHLYLELYIRSQAEVFDDIDSIINNAGQCSSKELCFEILLKLLKGFWKHPILASTDGDTWGKISRKVKKDYKAINDAADKLVIDKFEAAGITFRYPEDIVIKLLQSSCLAALTLLKSGSEISVCEIIIRALVEYIVDEGENKND
jgi:AcrR family transcriptional regulator